MKATSRDTELKSEFWAVQYSLVIFYNIKKSSKMTQILFFLVELELFSRFVKVSGQYEAPFPRYTSLKSFEYMAETLKWTPGFSRRMKNIRNSPIFRPVWKNSWCVAGIWNFQVNLKLWFREIWLKTFLVPETRFWFHLKSAIRPTKVLKTMCLLILSHRTRANKSNRRTLQCLWQLLLELPSLKANFEPFNIASEFFTISKKVPKWPKICFFW